MVGRIGFGKEKEYLSKLPMNLNQKTISVKPMRIITNVDSK